jgi:hypothetical protein
MLFYLGGFTMNSQNQVEEAHRLISMAILNSADGSSVRTPEGLVAMWVAQDTLLYLEAMLNYGNWRNARLAEPKREVRLMASRYGVRL